MTNPTGKTPQQLLDEARARPRVHTPRPALQPGRSSRPILPGQPVAPVATPVALAATPARVAPAKPTQAFKAAAAAPVKATSAFNAAANAPSAKYAFARAAAQGHTPPGQGMGMGKSMTPGRGR